MYSKINESSDDVIIIDDWRLLEETNAPANIKIIKIYITKSGVVSNNLSQISNSYENLIKENDCDLSIKFKTDWSNTKQLINVIEKFHVII